MPCVAPIPATRPVVFPGEKPGPLSLGVPLRRLDVSVADEVLSSSSVLLLPCGSCVGCQISRARDWAVRCSLELSLHSVASFVTLTYSDHCVPPTLSRLHLSRFMRYMRREVGKFRFFGCGEYGERRERPHYHAILFGTADREAAERSWGQGFVTMDIVNPARISYVAGYCAKKLGFSRPKEDVVDYSTGEVLYVHQPPFLQMSRGRRNPDGSGGGIGGFARKHWQSWRRSAVWEGREVPVPRFLHSSWKESASDSMLAALELEKLEAQMRPTVRELLAVEDIASARIRLKSERSQL